MFRRVSEWYSKSKRVKVKVNMRR